MRIVTTIALAAFGVLALVLPSAAQSGAVSEAPKTSYVPKQAVPQRLGPPEQPVPQTSRADKAAREDAQPASPVTRTRVLTQQVSPPQVAPQQTYPRLPAPQQAYAPAMQAAPTFFSLRIW